MKSWSVTARGLASVEVQGRNWIVALGRGLEELGRVTDVSRLACEVLPNGTVIARDIASGTGYVIIGVPDGDEVEEDPPTERPPVEEETFGEAPPDDEDDDDRSELDAEEDAAGEPIFELPADAIDALDEETTLTSIDTAETSLMACQLALAAALERVPAESGAVILDERGYLRFCAVTGPHSRKLMGVRLPMGTGVAGFAMEKRRTVVLVDAHEDPRHCGEVDALTGYLTREIAVIPIVLDGAVLGVVELMNLIGDKRFMEADVDAIQDVADALAHRLAR